MNDNSLGDKNIPIWKHWHRRRHFSKHSFLISLVAIVILIPNQCVQALHLKGVFDTNEFFRFLTRFGVQPTDMHYMEETQGYIYGNITLIDEFGAPVNADKARLPPIMLTVLDINNFRNYYWNRVLTPHAMACPMMFSGFEKLAYFYECNEHGVLDFIRRVPCPTQSVCVDEDNVKNLIPNTQFTVKIRDMNQARFWYVSLVACVRNMETCKWQSLSELTTWSSILPASRSTASSSQIDANSMTMLQPEMFANSSLNGMNSSTVFTTTSTSATTSASTSSQRPQTEKLVPITAYRIAYDIWLVNGNPSSKHNNHFEHQFSYESHDVFEIYLTSFLIYLFFIPFVFYRLKRHFHHLYMLLFIYISIEITGRFLSLIHNIVYSFDGHGVIVLDYLSYLLESLASSFLILTLICIAKGWTVRSRRLKSTRKFIMLGASLQTGLVASHMVALFTIDPVFNTNSYETKAGYFEMCLRILCMVWFLFELYETFGNLESAATNYYQMQTMKSVRKSHLSVNGDGDTPPLSPSSSQFPTTSSRSYAGNGSVNPDQGDETFADNREEEEDEDDDDDYFDNDYQDYDTQRNGKKYTNLNKMTSKLVNDELRNDLNESMSREERIRSYKKFYLHYGACCLVWFIYFPILVFITSFVSDLYRSRLVLSIRYFVNFISVAVLFYLMWSPKTPIKLPGKKPLLKYDVMNFNYHIHAAHQTSNTSFNEDDESDMITVFNKDQIT